MFLKNFFKENKTLIYTIVTVFILLESLVIVGVEYKQAEDTKNFLSIASPDFKKHIDISNKNQSQKANLFFDLFINKPKVIEIMFKASNTKDSKKLARLREKLYKLLTPIYTYMKTKDVRQLHFHLKDSVSFLRFHKPKKYGDSLKGVRETLDYVNKYKVRISAFEEGRIFNGFRNVYPLFKGDKFLGTVEISYSFSAMANELSKIDASSYLFMIKKSVVDSKVFKEEQSNYKESEFEDYVYDKATLVDNMQLRLKEIFKINRYVAHRVRERLAEGKLFSIYIKKKNIYENSTIVISFIPITNIESKTVAYVVHYEFENFIDIVLKNSKILLYVLTLLVLLVTMSLMMVLLHEKRKQSIAYEFAIHDALTGIFNRHGVNELINQQIEEVQRHKKALSLIFFDIDFFKKVNDTYGHDIGDYVLVNIAKIVSDEIRSSDIFARWGGEEFIIFLPETPLVEAIEVAQKLRKSIETHAFSSIDSITCSFGVTALQGKENKTSFIKRADELLYKAKESGRNCVISDFKS